MILMACNASISELEKAGERVGITLELNSNREEGDDSTRVLW